MSSRDQRQRSDERSSQSSVIQELSDLRRKRSEHLNAPARDDVDEQSLLEDSDCENEQPTGTAAAPPPPVHKPLRRLAQAGPPALQRSAASNSSADALANALQSCSLNGNQHSSNTSSVPRPSARLPATAASASDTDGSLLDDDSSDDEFVSASEASDSEDRVDLSSRASKPLPARATVTTGDPSTSSGGSTSLSVFTSTSGSISTGTASGSVAASSDSLPEPLVLGDRGQFVLAPKIARILYAHQLEGVKWLWSLHSMAGKGGILGDDMGLGKTLQCSAFLAGLLNSRLAKRMIVIAPMTLLAQWAKELTVVGLGSCVHRYYGTSESEREAALRAVLRGRGVLLTTYGMVLHNAAQLRLPSSGGGSYGSFRSAEQRDEEFKWDVMMLDEGHKIKNPAMKLVKELRTIPARMRVIITGTPIQNNLMELHALMDFCAEGVLGDARYFKQMYEKPIMRGQDSGATAREREHSAALATQFRLRMAPFFLRREKGAVMAASAAATAAEEEASSGVSADGTTRSASSRSTMQQLGRKNDLVVWLKMRPLQQSIYRAFLASDVVKSALNQSESPLAALVVLKKIADHPGLLSNNAASAVIAGEKRCEDGGAECVLRRGDRMDHGRGDRWAAAAKGGPSDDVSSSDSQDDGSDMDDFIDDSDDFIDDSSSGEDDTPPRRGGGKSQKGKKAATGGKAGGSKGQASKEDEGGVWAPDGGIEKALLEDLEKKGADSSCKTVFVLALLEELAKAGHRTLIFSQSRVMLDILQAGIKARRMSMLRIDGSVATADERAALVNKFQTTPTIPVLLLTAQVGGLGLTLTEADRVIILDPNWNPSIDSQSVDRAYRIGQRKDVVVYRLITCGTVEEKIYRRQVFKGGLSRTGTEEGVQFRYFTEGDLRDLFCVTEEGLQSSATHAQLHGLHASQRQATPQLLEHLAFLEGLDGCTGISDHDLLFSNKLSEVAPTVEEAARIVDESQRAAVAGAARAPRAAPSGGGRAATNQAAAELAALLSETRLQAKAPPPPTVPPRVAAARQALEVASKQHENQLTTYNNMRNMLPDGGSKILEKVRQLEGEMQGAVRNLRRAEEAADGDITGSGISDPRLARPSGAPAAASAGSTTAPPAALEEFRFAHAERVNRVPAQSALPGASARPAPGGHPGASGSGSTSSGGGGGGGSGVPRLSDLESAASTSLPPSPEVVLVTRPAAATATVPRPAARVLGMPPAARQQQQQQQATAPQRSVQEDVVDLTDD